MTETHEPAPRGSELAAARGGGAEPGTTRRRSHGIRLWVASVATVVALVAGLAVSWAL